MSARAFIVEAGASRPAPALFAVEVTVEDPYGSTATRRYVRPAGARLGRQAFTAYAVGDLIGLVSEGSWAGYSVVSVEEVTA